MPQASETISTTVSNSAVAITAFGFQASNLTQALFAYVTPIGAAIVVRWDGSAPTATAGHVVAENGMLEITGKTNINNLQFIRLADTDAEVSVTLEEN